MLLFLLYIYLGIGLIYGVYIYINTPEEWYKLPLNILGGPIAFVYIIYKAIAGGRMPRF